MNISCQSMVLKLICDNHLQWSQYFTRKEFICVDSNISDRPVLLNNTVGQSGHNCDYSTVCIINMFIMSLFYHSAMRFIQIYLRNSPSECNSQVSDTLFSVPGLPVLHKEKPQTVFDRQCSQN